MDRRVLQRFPKGNLYGTTVNGGDNSGVYGYGVAYKLSPTQGGTWNETILYKFTGGADGAYPNGGLTPGPGGYGYGTASSGGDTAGDCAIAQGCGTAFKVKNPADFSVLYTFTNTPDGNQPESPSLQGSTGSSYGTTFYGGANECQPTWGCGAVYEIDASGVESVIHSFLAPGDGDGANPTGGLIHDAAGNLYGTTASGGFLGAGICFAGCGTVYELSPTKSGGWNETVLYSFKAGSDGASPEGLIFDSVGNLYGTTTEGGNTACGSSGCGTIFKLSPQSGGKWAETILYTFTGAADGGIPVGLTRDHAGNLYGTTTYGGDLSCGYAGQVLGCGVVFRLDPAGKETVLHTFVFSGAGGLRPMAGLLLNEKEHTLYGTTGFGGDIANCNTTTWLKGCGVVFKITR